MEEASNNACKCKEHVSREEYLNLVKEFNTFKSLMSQTTALPDSLDTPDQIDTISSMQAHMITSRQDIDRMTRVLQDQQSLFTEGMSKITKLTNVLLEQLDQTDTLALMKSHMIRSNQDLYHMSRVLQDHQFLFTEVIKKIDTISSRLPSQLQNTDTRTNQIMASQSSRNPNPSSAFSEGQRNRNNDIKQDDMADSLTVGTFEDDEIPTLTDLYHKIKKAFDKNNKFVEEVKIILLAENKNYQRKMAISKGEKTLEMDKKLEQESDSVHTTNRSSNRECETEVLDKKASDKLNEEKLTSNDGFQCQQSSRMVYAETTQTDDKYYATAAMDLRCKSEGSEFWGLWERVVWHAILKERAQSEPK